MKYIKFPNFHIFVSRIITFHLTQLDDSRKIRKCLNSFWLKNDWTFGMWFTRSTRMFYLRTKWVRGKATKVNIVNNIPSIDKHRRRFSSILWESLSSTAVYNLRLFILLSEDSNTVRLRRSRRMLRNKLGNRIGV